MQGKAIRSTCGYCSTGCNLLVDPGTMKVIPNPDYPVNRGRPAPRDSFFSNLLKLRTGLYHPLSGTAGESSCLLTGTQP
jgi:anaerobic selenocysteine-containing dehydrogenase